METPGEVIVSPAGGARAADSLAVSMGALGLEVIDRDEIGGALLVRVPVTQEAAMVRALARRGDVAFAERNGVGSGGLVPNDTFFASQWHLENTGQSGGLADADVDAPEAWDITTGSSDVTIAVLDSGSEFGHPDFAGRLLPGGFDFVAEDADPEGDHPHGTWVAGMIAANADNGFAAAGMDWNVQILTVKVLNSNNAGTTFDLVQGLNFAAADPDVDIISLSLINYPAASSLITALANAQVAEGKILIACAGNNGIGNADVSWPGASPDTISVGASDRSDRRASFSGTGVRLDFVAPGSSVRTLRWQSSSDTVSSVSGCSFATPLTAGVASLLLARADEVGVASLSQEQVFEVLRLSADDEVGRASEDTPGRDDFHGWGRVNAAAALELIADCNGNGTLDLTDIALGASSDVDADLVPDECQQPACPGDVTGDNAVDGADLVTLLGAFGTSTPDGPSGGDLTGDGAVDGADLVVLLGAFGTTC
jgi:subtilisin family serine protease